jgi:hypothetical protein
MSIEPAPDPLRELGAWIEDARAEGLSHLGRPDRRRALERSSRPPPRATPLRALIRRLDRPDSLAIANSLGRRPESCHIS